MNSSPSTCPQCGAPLLQNSPRGLCPSCLVQAALDSPAEPAASPPTPEDLQWLAESFPQLEVEEMVGSGGMGRVYKARQPHLNRTVALKVLSPNRISDPEWLERFTREARALARLSHPHIVQVYDFGESPVPYLLMEFVDGVNLRQAMASGGISAREALAIVPKLCDALHYAHERGVLHRDIKPENILIDIEGHVKVVDFGLAKLRDEGALAFTLTQSGAKLGTLAYMAPEQVERPHEVDHRADIYSLGVVLYEMLTGELPLGRFPNPSEASGVDPRLDGVVLRTLEKHKERRFQSADDFRTDLERACDGPPPAPRAYEWNRLDFDFQTRAKIRGLPLLHIAFGKDLVTGRHRCARGLLAIGGHATGLIALGLFARGLFAWGIVSVGLVSSGVLSLGLISFGVGSLGLFFSHGVFALAPYALGVTAIGYLAAGVKAYGIHSAAVQGPIDAEAATFADAWLNRLMHGSMIANSIGLTIIMTAGLCAAYATHAKHGRRDVGVRLALLYAVLALIGPLAYLTFANTAQGPNFTSLAKKAAREEQMRSKRELLDHMNQVRKLAEPWFAQASRTDSPAARDAAVQEMISALRSTDETRIQAGLTAMMRIAYVQMDKAPLRQAARPHLESANPSIRAQAARSLMTADAEPADHQRILALIPVSTKTEWAMLAYALGQIAQRDYTGAYGEPMLLLLNRTVEDELQNPTYSSISDIFQPLWGAKFSPEIERKVIGWSYLRPRTSGLISTGGLGYDAFYYALSTQANKSAASVKRLLELAQHPDTTNIAGRCLWGMRGTVAKEADRATVSAAVLKLLEHRNEGYLWKQGLGLLRDYCGKQDLPALAALADREALPKDQRDALHNIIQSVKTKS